MTISKPDVRPARPFFSSGPCAKPPGWGPEHLALGSLGRSHRSKLGKARLGHAIELTRHVLRVPASHRIGIVPASDTGAAPDNGTPPEGEHAPATPVPGPESR